MTDENCKEVLAAERGSTDDTVFRPANTHDKLLSLKNIAKLLKDSMPPYIQPIYTEKFLIATTAILGENATFNWKELCESTENDDEKTPARRQVTFGRIERLLSKLILKESKSSQGLPNPQNFKGGKGMEKYFMQKHKSEPLDRMKQFAGIYGGFICKLYYSKEGHDKKFEELKSCVGAYIAEQGLLASQISCLFNFKLMLPSEVVKDIYFVDFIHDDSTSNEIELQYHTIQEDAHLQEILATDMSRVGCKVLPYSEDQCQEMIEQMKQKVEELKRGIVIANQQIACDEEKISALNLEILSLEKLETQLSNNRDFVLKARDALPGSEGILKETFKILFEIIPAVMPLIGKVDLGVLEDKVKGIILEYAEELSHQCNYSQENVSDLEDDNGKENEETPEVLCLSSDSGEEQPRKRPRVDSKVNPMDQFLGTRQKRSK